MDKPDLRPQITASALSFCAALSVVCPLLLQPDSLSYDPYVLGAAARMLLLLLACVLVFTKPRLGYALGLAASLLTLFYAVRLEWDRPWSVWITLNAQGPSRYVLLPVADILSAVLPLVAVACFALRLLPANMGRRTWPAVALGGVALAVWFLHSATPYAVPTFAHGISSDLRILHTQKRGLHFHEVSAHFYRDGRVWLDRDDRRLFQYSFTNHVRVARFSPDRVRLFVESTRLDTLRTPLPKALRSWNAEGWYVVIQDRRVLSFTTEYGTTPPPALTALFREIESLPPSEERPFLVRDVCLGFCYDPVAALGFDTLGRRERLLESNAR